jgi:hypothetical protein
MPGNSSAINWAVLPGSPILLNEYYLKWSKLTFGGIDANLVKADLTACLASNESAELIAYLSWLLRVKALLA